MNLRIIINNIAASRKLLSTALLALLLTNSARSQTTSDFENLTLPADSYWNGSDMSGGFQSGNAYFPSTFDNTYSFWSSGWAYSNIKDSVTAGFGNMYSARPASGANNSSNYAIGQQGAVIRLTGIASGKAVNGIWITNSTYAALSMRDGDSFSKKFGGNTGNDPDWFLLSISGFFNGSAIQDTVRFYLADFRFSDNMQDYIVNTWEYADLSPLGNIDSLVFSLSSSDNGMYGMNTPAFFCVDNFTTADLFVSVNENTGDIHKCFPNPASDYIRIDGPALKQIRLFNAAGICVYDQSKPVQGALIDVRDLPKGLYLIEMLSTEDKQTEKIMIQ